MIRNPLSVRLLKSATFLLGALVLFEQAGQAAGTEPLNFFKNWFITGDVKMAGVGLRGVGDVNGIAHGTIHMAGVPADAEVLSAYLYWATDETTASPGAINGTFDNVAITGTVLGANPACWSSGGTGGPSGGSARAYRADVRPILQKDP